MWPFIRNGTVLTVGPAGAEDLCTGEAVLYRSGNRLAVHRIARIQMNGSQRIFHIRADFWPFICESVPETDVLGRVIKAERGGKVCRLAVWCPDYLIVLFNVLTFMAHGMGLSRMLVRLSAFFKKHGFPEA